MRLKTSKYTICNIANIMIINVFCSLAMNSIYYVCNRERVKGFEQVTIHCEIYFTFTALRIYNSFIVGVAVIY